MQELSNRATPNASEEVLLSREITFRNSTFGALKTFMRDHQRRTGQTLSNAAAVDMILRAHLVRHIHPNAVKIMAELSRPQTVRILQAMPHEALDESLSPDVAPMPKVFPVINMVMKRAPRAPGYLPLANEKDIA